MPSFGRRRCRFSVADDRSGATCREYRRVHGEDRDWRSVGLHEMENHRRIADVLSFEGLGEEGSSSMLQSITMRSRGANDVSASQPPSVTRTVSLTVVGRLSPMRIAWGQLQWTAPPAAPTRRGTPSSPACEPATGYLSGQVTCNNRNRPEQEPSHGESTSGQAGAEAS